MLLFHGMIKRNRLVPANKRSGNSMFIAKTVNNWVTSLDPDSRPAKGKRETSARKNGKAKQVKTAVSKQPETKAAEEEMPAVTEAAQQDTATTVEPAMLTQSTAEDDNQKYYYGVGGLLLGSLLTSPLYFRNRKKNG